MTPQTQQIETSSSCSQIHLYILTVFLSKCRHNLKSRWNMTKEKFWTESVLTSQPAVFSYCSLYVCQASKLSHLMRNVMLCCRAPDLYAEIKNYICYKTTWKNTDEKENVSVWLEVFSRFSACMFFNNKYSPISWNRLFCDSRTYIYPSIYMYI